MVVFVQADTGKITRRESLQRTLPKYVMLAMDALSGVHQRCKTSSMPEATRQMASGVHVCNVLVLILFLADFELGGE